MDPPTLAELVTEVGISPALLDQKCSDEDLVSISEDLDWRGTAPHLGLSATDIEDIDCKRTEPEKRVETLRKWKRKFGFRAKIRMLLEKLLEAGNADHAETVCRLLKQQDEETPLPPPNSDSPTTTNTGATKDPLAPQPTTNWEYQTFFKNSAAITEALAANRLTNHLANELKSRKLIGQAVYELATNYGPGVTESMRVKHLIDAMLSKVKLNQQRYYDLIAVLRLDSLCADAEAALTLLPTGPSQAGGQTTAAEPARSKSKAAAHPTVTTLPPPTTGSSTSTSTGATEDTLNDSHQFEITSYLMNLDRKQVYNLGLVFGLRPHKVNMMKNSDMFLDDVLAAWLRREDDVDKQGIPSWRTLVKALRHKLLGQNGIASDICRDKGIS